MKAVKLMILLTALLTPAVNVAEEVGEALKLHVAASPIETLDEVLVVGTQPGPPLWQVRSGDNVLWILANVRFVAKSMKWRSKQVERVLADTKEVLTIYGGGDAPQSARSTASLSRKEREAQLDQYRHLPDGKALRDVIPSDVYTHFELVRAAFPSRTKARDRDIERFTPDWARNSLWNRAMEALKLGLDPVTSKVVDMAKRVRVEVTVVEPLVFTRFAAVPSVESAMDFCPLSELLQDLDGRGARWIARANAWAVGDVERLVRFVTPDPIRTPECLGRHESFAVEGAAGARLKEVWLAAMERSLADNSSTFAVVDAALLLPAGGLLDVLRSRGYEVIDP